MRTSGLSISLGDNSGRSRSSTSLDTAGVFSRGVLEKCPKEALQHFCSAFFFAEQRCQSGVFCKASVRQVISGENDQSRAVFIRNANENHDFGSKLSPESQNWPISVPFWGESRPKIRTLGPNQAQNPKIGQNLAFWLPKAPFRTQNRTKIALKVANSRPKIRFRAQSHKNSQIQKVPLPLRDGNHPKMVLKVGNWLKLGNSVPSQDWNHPQNCTKTVQTGDFGPISGLELPQYGTGTGQLAQVGDSSPIEAQWH